MQAIHDYYDKLAKDYDSDRFGNSYGRYIDRMEREIVSAWLAPIAPEAVLDIGCGTGRMLDFAMSGVDASPEMLKQAAQKFPDRRLRMASLPALDVDVDLGTAFQGATCFHVFMHLDKECIAQSLQSIARVVEPGGIFIFDIPSQRRRALNRRGQSGWHGDTAATYAEVEQWAGSAWRMSGRCGVLLFPIHRLPPFARPFLRKLDALLGRTFLSAYSSYHVYRLERLP
ncbi:ubiquinone/menaquinone biosynthesis C-methylase UbiE [Oxalobacteraceae bacterium GrIS 1.11]